MRELDRTEAFNRGVLLVVSPTGTGYVNYQAVEALEYLTRGDCVTVTLQYSKRPSPLSLGRVEVGRSQNEMLFLSLWERLEAMESSERPRVLLFGESLGPTQARMRSFTGNAWSAGSRHRLGSLDRDPVRQRVEERSPWPPAPRHRRSTGRALQRNLGIRRTR